MPLVTVLHACIIVTICISKVLLLKASYYVYYLKKIACFLKINEILINWVRCIMVFFPLKFSGHNKGLKVILFKFSFFQDITR